MLAFSLVLEVSFSFSLALNSVLSLNSLTFNLGLNVSFSRELSYP